MAERVDIGTVAIIWKAGVSPHFHVARTLPPTRRDAQYANVEIRVRRAREYLGTRFSEEDDDFALNW
jgi:hypothetical protein